MNINTVRAIEWMFYGMRGKSPLIASNNQSIEDVLMGPTIISLPEVKATIGLDRCDSIGAPQQQILETDFAFGVRSHLLAGKRAPAITSQRCQSHDNPDNSVFGKPCEMKNFVTESRDISVVFVQKLVC